LTTSATHLIEEMRQRREAMLSPQRIESREPLAVPEPLNQDVDGAIAQPSDGTACRMQADAERRQAFRRQRIDVRQQHIEGNTSRFGSHHATQAEHRTDHEVRMRFRERVANVVRVGRSGADKQRGDQSLDELPRVLALPVTRGIVLASSIGSVRRLHPWAEAGAGGANLTSHRVLGEDRHDVPSVDEATDGTQLGRDIAAAVNESEQVPAGLHRANQYLGDSQTN
jgi:hypothetical protein